LFVGELGEVLLTFSHGFWGVLEFFKGEGFLRFWVREISLVMFVYCLEDFKCSDSVGVLGSVVA
jgi:hypothetical protein